VIDGKRPGDRPFMTIRRIDLRVPVWYWALVQRNIQVEVRLRDWKMLVEKWKGGEHNLPRLTRPRKGPSRPMPFKTTVNVYALDGDFTYEDHETPWLVHAHDLNFDLVRAENLKQYVGLAHFAGDVKILDYRPMATSMSLRFILDGPLVRLQHVDLITEGARTHASGLVDFNNWARADLQRQLHARPGEDEGDFLLEGIVGRFGRRGVQRGVPSAQAGGACAERAFLELISRA
jgi:hypothetical protein